MFLLRKLITSDLFKETYTGGSEHSFGIHVAKMAGMPQPF